jgi:hypothetical protein
MDKGLALDANHRFQDAETFADAIREVAHENGLLYSAPQLAAELREILGNNPDTWLREEGDPRASGERLAQTGSELEGYEVSSVGGDAPEVKTPTRVERPRASGLRPSAGDVASRPSGSKPAEASSPSPAPPPRQPHEFSIPDKQSLPGPATPPAEPMLIAPAPLVPQAFPPVRVVPPRGGVAATRGSKRSLWIALAVATAALATAAVLFLH